MGAFGPNSPIDSSGSWDPDWQPQPQPQSQSSQNQQSQSGWSGEKLKRNWSAYGRYLALNKFGVPANSPNSEKYVRALAKQMGVQNADTASLDDLYAGIGAAVYEKVFQGWGQAGEIENPDKFIEWMNKMESDSGEKGQLLRNVISTYENTWKGVAQSMYTNEMEGLQSQFQQRMRNIYQGDYKDYVDKASLELEQRRIGLQEKANALGLFRTLGALEAQKQMGNKLSDVGEAILKSNISAQQQMVQSVYDQARTAVLQKEYATAKQAALGALQQEFQTKAQITGTNLNIDLSKIEGLRSMFNFSIQQEMLNAEREAARRQAEEAKKQAEASTWGSLIGVAGTLIGGIGGGLLFGPAGASIGAAVGGGLASALSGLFLGPSATYGGQTATSGLAPAFSNWDWEKDEKEDKKKNKK
jgi:hypothetical protein